MLRSTFKAAVLAHAYSAITGLEEFYKISRHVSVLSRVESMSWPQTGRRLQQGLSLEIRTASERHLPTSDSSFHVREASRGRPDRALLSPHCTLLLFLPFSEKLELDVTNTSGEPMCCRTAWAILGRARVLRACAGLLSVLSAATPSGAVVKAWMVRQFFFLNHNYCLFLYETIFYCVKPMYTSNAGSICCIFLSE